MRDGGEEQEEPNRKVISRMPMELGRKICTYLDATDLVNLCLALPQWKWMLNTPPFCHVLREGVEEWKWLDNYLCQLLFDGDANINCENVALATAYRNQQDATYHRLSHEKFTKHTLRPVHCLFLPSKFNASRLQGNVQRYRCDLQVVGCAPPTRIYFDVASDATHFHHHWRGFSHASVGACCQMLSEMRLEERRCVRDYDCVIVDADYGDATGVFSAGISDLLRSMTPSQTIIATGSLLYIRGLVSNLDCMQAMFWELGGLELPPLSQLSASWRIWCNQHQNDTAIDLVEIVRWVCLDVFAKRSGATLCH